jgi:acetyltransferase-like isoleucine patch superfamily enzyme
LRELVAGTARLSRFRLRAVNACCGLLPDYVSSLVRARAYQAIGLRIASSASIMGNLDLVSGTGGAYDRLRIGKGAIIGTHVTINLDEEVIIGPDVSISPHVRIYTATHMLGPGSRRMIPSVVAKPVTIEGGTWIGIGAMILPGVTVGRGSVVAAGAVVTRDVPPNSFVEGNPARVARELPWGDR